MKKPYMNKGGDSNIEFYEEFHDHIIIWFRGTSKKYSWSASKVGNHHIQVMRGLANQGKGLNNYIKLHVQNDYDA